MLNLEGINAFYGTIQALKNISLKVGAGDIVTIIGANGAGKTTLLKAISGVIQSESGTIWYQGTNIIQYSSAVKIVSMGISQVPEGRQLFSHLTVSDNLHLGAYLYHNRKFKHEIEEKLESIYHLFPILRKTGQAVGRNHERRRTTDGGHCQGFDVPSQASSSR